MKYRIPLFKSYSDEKDMEAVLRIVKRALHWANGPEIKEFEDRIAEHAKKEYALAFNSGTSALHTLLACLGIEGFEVIVPSFTFISSANCVLMAGARPVFADIEEETFGLDADDVEGKINKNTKAVILVHYAGCPAKNTLRIKKMCQENDIFFIEDAAEAMGSSVNGEKVGGFGDAVMYSFCQNKIVATGEGGAIAVNSREIYEKMKMFRSHGRREGNREYFSDSESLDYEMLGYNYRMPTLCAALGCSQFEKIDLMIRKRQENAAFMTNALTKVVKTPSAPEGFEHVYQLYTIRAQAEKRDILKEFLDKNEIMSKVYFNPVHLTKFYRKQGFSEGSLPTTEKVGEEVLSLPIFVEMKDDELKLIVEKVNEFFEGDSK